MGEHLTPPNLGDRDQAQKDRDLAATMAALRAVNAASVSAVDAGVAKLPGKGEWIKAAPGVGMVCATMVVISFVAVFTVLTITGSPTDPFFRLINLFLNALGAIATLATLAVAMLHARRTMENRRIAQSNADDAHEAVVASTEAAAASRSAADAVNGGLEDRIESAMTPIVQRIVEQAVGEALRASRDTDPT